MHVYDIYFKYLNLFTAILCKKLKKKDFHNQNMYACYSIKIDQELDFIQDNPKKILDI